MGDGIEIASYERGPVEASLLKEVLPRGHIWAEALQLQGKIAVFIGGGWGHGEVRYQLIIGGLQATKQVK